MRAGCEELKIDPEGCRLVLEEDGTEIKEHVDVAKLAVRTFILILLGKYQCWSSASAATPAAAPVPEPSKPIEPPSEHSQAASGN